MAIWDYVCDHCGRKNPKQGGPCRWCGKEMVGEWAVCNNCDHGAADAETPNDCKLTCPFMKERVNYDDPACKRYWSLYRVKA